MAHDETSFPHSVPDLPDQALTLDFIRRFHKSDDVRDVWIPRGTSSDDLECDEEDILQLPFGYVPTAQIGRFFVQKGTTVTEFERLEDGWHIVSKIERDDVPAQAFVYMMKPYVAVRRVLAAKRH